MKKILIVLCAVMLGSSLAACGGSESDSISDQEIAETEIVGQIIYEDNIFKATYLGISEISGVVMLNVRLENKTDSEITVYPTDSSVDDTMVQFTSGVPATMQGGKNLTQSWIIGSVPTERVEFSMWVCDENTTTLVQTDIITISMD